MKTIRMSSLPAAAQATLRKLDRDRTDAARQAAEARRKQQAAEDLRNRRIAYMIARGIPKPETELRFHPARLWRFDFAWSAKMVALEVHGGIWFGGHHSGGKSQMDDWDKLNEAQLLGWRVFQCSPQQLDSGAIHEVLRSAIHQTKQATQADG